MTHNIKNSLTGKLLLSMPQMGDPRFQKSVIFMCAHDKNGAMGIVVNHLLNDIKFSDLLDQLQITSNIHIDMNALSIPVMNGGPVNMARGFLLHSPEFSHEGTMKVGNRYGVTGTINALKDLATGNGPAQKLFALGYAGWGAGQLEQELQDNTWLVIESNPDLVYNINPEKKWDIAIEQLGFDPSLISNTTGQA